MFKLARVWFFFCVKIRFCHLRKAKLKLFVSVLLPKINMNQYAVLCFQLNNIYIYTVHIYIHTVHIYIYTYSIYIYTYIYWVGSNVFFLTVRGFRNTLTATSSRHHGTMVDPTQVPVAASGQELLITGPGAEDEGQCCISKNICKTLPKTNMVMENPPWMKMYIENVDFPLQCSFSGM